MIFSRIVSFVLRFFEFIFALIVTATSGWFLHVRHVHAVGAKGRLIFTICIALYSLILSMIWLIPFTATFLHYPLDAFASIFYFVAFAILQEWIYHYGCGRIFEWNGEYHMGQCMTYRTMTAFSFIAGVFWLISAILVSFPFFSGGDLVTQYYEEDAQERRV
ncbi:integral membrane protein [Venturia nashicola]|uniref:Integral membrane protein n=1 Tax=Venturia nashicola TaxID=86259 RepID=A0A4Z1PBI4_9PEZI|nr:integral membrane protein [Venturia nashicola]